jgi:endogenous inhibitor of DNA gyrase (YacG/DUF329 family)
MADATATISQPGSREMDSREAAAPSASMDPIPCAWCGEPFQPKTVRQQACGQTCRNRLYWRTPEGKAKVEESKARHRAKLTKPCAACGEPTRKTLCSPCAVRRRSPNWGVCKCGTECLLIAPLGVCPACEPTERSRLRRIKVQRRVALTAAGTISRQIITSGRCHYCGDQFTSRASEPARFCSQRCKRGDIKARARARSYDVWIQEVNRSAVFRRHDWRCHICHEPVDPMLPPNDPMSASLDHVIPLIGRGPHVEANLRPAHMMCNSLKSIDEHGLPIIATHAA